MKTDNTYQHWLLNIDKEHIAWLTFDRQDRSVNVIDQITLKELDQIIDELNKQPLLQGLVICSGKSSGIVGADVKQFSKFSSEEEAGHFLQLGRDVFHRVASLTIPKVIMIHGSCLGGGYELALMCDYRIALDDEHTLMGLPEIKLGIYPGWGGMQLINLIGLLPAMNIILKGKSVDARQAKRLGMVDSVVPQRHYKRAARSYIARRPKLHKPAAWQELLEHRWARPWVGKLLLSQLQKAGVKESQYPAPFIVVKNWMEADGDISEGFQDASRRGPREQRSVLSVHEQRSEDQQHTRILKGKGYSHTSSARELRSVAELFHSPTCMNLLYVFSLREKLKAHTKKCERQLKHVHVMGAGTMGAGIATRCAYAGYQVSIYDVDKIQLGKAIQHVHSYMRATVKTMTGARGIQAIMDRVIPDEMGFFLKTADVVIEAAPENLELKQRIFKELEVNARTDAILATNTSSIPLEEIACVLHNPNRLVGLHFFNPAEKMPLIEVVQTPTTDEHVLNTALSFVGKLSALPLPVKSYPGFLVNRILMSYLLEAAIMLQENVPAYFVDQAAKEFGMPVGPIELMDRIGLDVCYLVAEKIATQNRQVLEQLIEKIKQGNLGAKTNIGFYSYKKGKKLMPTSNAGQQPIALSKEQIMDRLIFCMINEAAHCLQQGIVPDYESIDAGMIFGTGFPPFRGGLYRYTQSLGREQLIEKFELLTSQYGERFECRIDWAQWALSEG